MMVTLGHRWIMLDFLRKAALHRSSHRSILRTSASTTIGWDRNICCGAWTATCSSRDDNCPDDPNKTEPGTRGRGVLDVYADGDGTMDWDDGCPSDPAPRARYLWTRRTWMSTETVMEPWTGNDGCPKPPGEDWRWVSAGRGKSGHRPRQ